MTDTSRVITAITQVVITFVASAIAIFFWSFFIQISWLIIALIAGSCFIFSDITLIMSCEGDSIIIGTWERRERK